MRLRDNLVRLGLEDQAVNELVARPVRTDKLESVNLISEFRIRQADEEGGNIASAEFIFGISLVLLIASLAVSAWEIQISVRALNIQLGDLENVNEKKVR